MTEHDETTQEPSSSNSKSGLVAVMPFGYLPDFEGKPILASCYNCIHCMDQSDGPGLASWYACEKPGMEHVNNLRSFPFKTTQKCCELSIAYTVDWETEAKKL